MRLLGKYSGFRALWTGQLLSQMGNAVFLIMGLWEIQLRQPVLLAGAGLAMTIPAGLAVFGGVYVDRMDPRRLMLWTDVLRGSAVALGLVALMVPGSLMAVIIALLGVNSLGNALFGPSESVLIPWLVAPEDLAGANGLYSLTAQLASTAGSALGGAAIVALGVTVVFGMDLASFWLSALAILLMMRTVAARPRTHTTGDARAGFWPELRSGFQSLKTLPGMIQLMPIAVAANFAGVAAFTMFPYWVRTQLHAGALSYGLIDASFAAGLVLGSLSVGAFRRWPIRYVAAVAFGLQALLLGAFALTSAPIWAGGWLFVAGASNGVGNALLFTLFQRLVPDALRGRVFGMLFSLVTMANPLGALAAGVFLHVLPLWWAWALMALTGLGLTAGILVWMPKDADQAPNAGAAAAGA
ncbi:MAG: MFS transporter [Thermaerobacter sp.]|nr:MFS transporter [Thermaerobacter sp.]